MLEGEKGAPRDAVLLNAGAALVIAGAARELRGGAESAAAAVDDGRAVRLLEQMAVAGARGA